jgi:N utilization substance protein A
VDIVLWDENPARFVINAMAPAEVESIVVDEDSNSMRVAVVEEKLAQAIGRGGQNVRLASELTGWNLNVMTLEESEAVSEEEAESLQKMFMEELDVDEEVGVILVQEGFSSIEEVAYVPTHELLGIEEFNEDIVEELRNRARDVLLTRAIASAEGGDAPQPTEDLLGLKGMDNETAKQLTAGGIVTREDLAEQAADDVVGAIGIEAERAAQLIMEARAPWFAEEQSTNQP